MNLLESIRIILVNTTHPGNIGATARAMKNMGLKDLYLVDPYQFPHVEATARASGADDLLEKAKVVPTLAEAVKDCGFVIGTTARTRGIPWPVLDLRTAAKKTLVEAERGPVAILFGQERAGLTNEELEYCHAVINIPCNPEYTSLNLAQAVQLVTYEIRMSWLEQQEKPIAAKKFRLDRPASAAEMEGFYEHLRETLIQIGFLNPMEPKKIMRRMIRLFNRTQLEKREINILRGMLSAMQEKIND